MSSRRPPCESKARQAVLLFGGTDNPEWGDIEVKVRLGISIETFLRLKDLVDQEDAWALAREFGDSMLIGWNLVGEDDQPISPTGKGMSQLPDIALATAIVNKWLEAVAGVPAPLGPPSADGNTLVEASTALEPE